MYLKGEWVKKRTDLYMYSIPNNESKEAGTVSTVIWPPKISEIIRIS
jgi:hypothetical protein